MSSMLGLVSTVLIAAWCDWSSWRIPNRLLAASATAALVLALFAADGIGLSASIAGGLTGLALFLPLYLLKGMAAGDVKLLATLGLFAGPLLTVDLALWSFLAGGVWALIYLMAQTASGQFIWTVFKSVCGSDFPSLKNKTMPPALHGKTRKIMPYGVVMAGGVLTALMTASI